MRTSLIHAAAVEEIVKTMPDGGFDVVFTMAVLEHIHTQSQWVFSEMARIHGRLLLTIEDEPTASVRHFPRNYRKIFERLGFRQVEEIPCTPEEGLTRAFMARVFSKEEAR